MANTNSNNNITTDDNLIEDKQYQLNLNKFELFSGKTYEGLLNDIYMSQSKTDRVLDSTIQQLKSLISNNAPLRDIALLLPLIKDFVSLSVKNQDSLVKLASIVEKIVNDHRINLNNQRTLNLKESSNAIKPDKARVTLSSGKRRDNNDLTQNEIAKDDALQLTEDEKRQLLETMEETHQSLISNDISTDDIQKKIDNTIIDTEIKI